LKIRRGKKGREEKKKNTPIATMKKYQQKMSKQLNLPKGEKKVDAMIG